MKIWDRNVLIAFYYDCDILRDIYSNLKSVVQEKHVLFEHMDFH